MPPRASILVPTHSHASTLALSVGSALAQTVTELEVLIIGDGVSPELRDVANALATADPRVRFVDHPKGENHGEAYRDLAIHDARSDAIFYLCDDDILMPDHVADLLDLLETRNFVQSKNGYFTEDGEAVPYVGDLADPAAVAQMLRDDVTINFVSITGTAHSRRFYLDVGAPWGPTPPGMYPDWFQWRKLLRNSAFRGATSERMTALQFPSSQGGRDEWSPERRLEELERWAAIAAATNGQAEIDRIVARGDRVRLTEQMLRIEEMAAWSRRPSVKAADNLATLARRVPIVRRIRDR
jgi:hypothetical protein